ncbi:hypothetical protein [Bacteroides timonensis]|uniref:hypothetical protein n=1 Tax=Bacteroides timonensis TaxID=1470345 RepID=UPI0005C739F5|nr:hypothetical protein [Bacteroides timonensis]
MHFVHNILIVLFTLLLIVGCRSSRSGTSHSDIETNHLKETRTDSLDFKGKFARYLHEQESDLTVRIVEFFPPEPGDTASHGPVKSVTDIDLSSKSKSDSTINETQLTLTCDTTSEQFHETETVDTTYQVKQVPWYQPFLPYLVLIFLATLIHYLRRKK